MNAKSDDMSAFRQYTGLSENAYKTFKKHSLHSLKNEAEAGLPRDRKSEPQETANAVPYSRESGLAELVELMRLNESRDDVWSGLKSVLDRSKGIARLEEPSSLPDRTVAFFGVSGGVGVTTIVASVTRLLSSRGRNVLAVDSDTPFLLPLHFSVGAASRNMTFVHPRRPTEGSLQLLPASGFKQPDAVRTLIGQCRLRIDDLVVGASSPDPLSKAALREQSVSVAILNPDVNSVVGLQCLEQITEAPDVASPMYLLLNRFEPMAPLHVDFRRFLSREFGDRLLPFFIRRTDSFPEALAEGRTVIDHVPGTEVVEDLSRLAGWLESTHGKPRALAASAAT